ncbi:MAG: Cytochrome c [Verrucomicrobia bacterium]|nr:Cytochrome c [Verrucomicrobiota bacterium]
MADWRRMKEREKVEVVKMPNEPWIGLDGDRKTGQAMAPVPLRHAFLSFRNAFQPLHSLHCMKTRFVSKGLMAAILAALALVRTEAAEFPKLYNSETDLSVKIMPAEDVVKELKLPPGFKATVFAAEPNVQNPIAMTWDSRGRLWVAENYTYSERKVKFEMNLRDRLLIFEDRDGDGKFDRRTVFSDQVQMLTSVEIGLGGVWLMCPPQMLFIPDRDGDDKPDGPTEVVLDGFNPPAENYHNFANGLRFGPDGWLYGRCGASSPGEIGAPGTPAKERIPMRGGMWRYHPQTKVFEALTSGTTNPWGHDWNKFGELFFINTVNGHLWHAMPGAHFVRPHTIDPNPHTYGLIDMHADHWHFDTGKSWTDSRDGKADSYGGGHAHIGMMIYQGDNWPIEYQDKLFTLNMHGRRVNREILQRDGSGYVGKHGEDLLNFTDKWFRGMELSCGPDGSVFIADWSDTGECHDSTGVHRESGRIYKVMNGKPKRPALRDLRVLTDGQLINLQRHYNVWFANQARLELADRFQRDTLLKSSIKDALDLYKGELDIPLKLRIFWALNAMGVADETFLRTQLSSRLKPEEEYIRAWSVRLLTDKWPLDTPMSERPVVGDTVQSPSVMNQLVRLAKDEKSAAVRLVLASTLQRLPVAQRADLATALVTHKEDADDHNIPLMIWYGLIPVANQHPEQLAAIAARCELPKTRQYITRRLAEELEKNPALLNTVLQTAAKKSDAFQLDVLTGLSEALRGWRKAVKPAAWDSLASSANKSRDEKLVALVRELSVVFGDGRALDDVKALALNGKADIAARKAALQTLIDSKPDDLRQICEQLLSVRFLNPVAARGLAQFNDPIIGDKLVKAYKGFHPSERPQLLATLVSRPSFAKSLLDAIGANVVSKDDLSAFHARQIRSFNDEKLNQQLGEVWGVIRDSDADKKKLMAEWKAKLTPASLGSANKSAGREVYNLICANCHKLYGEGGIVGPDLTGAGRDNIDFLLENIIDPSGVVNADFRMSVVELKDGRTLNGVIRSKNARTLSVQTMTELLTIEQTEVDKLTESTLSLMPEGLVEALTEQQVRDLIAYLMNRSQVPLPGAAK